MKSIDLRLPPCPMPKYASIGPKPERITVACVWWGTLYGPEYVQKLYNSVKRNLSIPFDFVCITDRDYKLPGIEMIQTPTADEGWWQKVNLFKPELFAEHERVLYLDLDVVILNSLDPIASVCEPFVMIENFGPNKHQSAHNSSCVVWTPSEETERIYTAFNKQVVEALHGDQCWMWRVMGNDIHDFPKDLVDSYKYRKRPQWNRTSNRTSVLVFHGKPKPHEVRDPEIVRNWK